MGDGTAHGADKAELEEMVATDHVVKMHLASCIVHLLERARADHHGDGHVDFIAAKSALQQPSVAAYLRSMPDVMFPLPRDGKLPFDFPGQ